MSTDFTFSELYSSSTIIRFYDSSGGLDFNFTEDGYTAVSDSVSFSFGDSVLRDFSALPCSGDFYNSIWAEPAAGKNVGKIFIGTPDSFIVLNLKTKTIIDYYTKDHMGITGDKLNNEDSVDINVVGF